MKWLQKESGRYAFLLVVLLTTAAIAVTATISYLHEIVPQREQLVIATTVIWALTMGFMLIAGAFGLWAVHFAAEAESLRRLGSLVDAMDYIHDGVMALNRQGKVTGLNPAAIAIFGTSIRNTLLTDSCPALSAATLDAFLHTNAPVEAETEVIGNGLPRTLRLRSQPSTGIVILLVSDVTDLVRNRERSRRTAYVQLIGHMAKGVANDFNDLLCGIAGHASLLTRLHRNTLNVTDSAAAIQDCAGRGMLLARQLMQLTAPGADDAAATLQTARHVEAGIDLLKSSLPADWNISRTVGTHCPPVNIPPVQLEHLVQSLGLVVADAAPTARHIAVSLHAAPEAFRDRMAAAVLTVSASVAPDQDPPPHLQITATDTAGVVTAVIDALVVQAGGKLESFNAEDGTVVYRILLPAADATALAAEAPTALAIGLEAYASNWHILIDRQIHESDACTDYLQLAGIHARSAQGIVHLLSAIENDNGLDAIVLDSTTLGDDQASLLKAIARLSPQAGIVVQRDDLQDDGVPGIIYVPVNATPLQLLHAMIEARSRARANHHTR